MSEFKEVSAAVRALEHNAISEIQTRLPEDKGRRYQYRAALGGEGPTFKSLVAEVKRLEKILAASRYGRGRM